jgi:hypothetical protein
MDLYYRSDESRLSIAARLDELCEFHHLEGYAIKAVGRGWWFRIEGAPADPRSLRGLLEGGDLAARPVSAAEFWAAKGGPA